MIKSDQKEELIAEYPELSEEGIILQKEMYAHFGLLFFKFSLVEHSLINALLFHHLGTMLKAGKITNRRQWEEQWDSCNADVCGKTFGTLVGRLIKVQEFRDLAVQLRQAAKHRNYFAHSFFREEVAIYMEDDGIWHLLWEFQQIGRSVHELDKAMQPRMEHMCQRIGIPLPNKDQQAQIMGDIQSEAQATLGTDAPKFGWHNLSE